MPMKSGVTQQKDSRTQTALDRKAAYRDLSNKQKPSLFTVIDVHEHEGKTSGSGHCGYDHDFGSGIGARSRSRGRAGKKLNPSLLCFVQVEDFESNNVHLFRFTLTARIANG